MYANIRVALGVCFSIVVLDRPQRDYRSIHNVKRNCTA